jgi:shikimate dehydrogenase
VKAGVIGSPISHSLSPFIFNFVARMEGHPINYNLYDVKASDSKSFFQSLKKEKDFLGLNVTLPLKELFLEHIDFISPEVKALGALNVLHFKESKISGFNTDIIGIQKTLEDKKFLVAGKTCLLLGAGGAAKAVAYVLGTMNAKTVLVFNRSEKNRELVNDFSSLFPAIAEL